MFVPFVRKKRLATYSKKTPRTNPRLTFASPTSHDRQNQRRQVALTSPVRNTTLPTSPNPVSLSSESGDGDDGDEVQHAPDNFSQSKTRKRSKKPTNPRRTHERTSTQSSSRANSPVSSSENDSISDAASVSVERTQRHKKPRLLSTLRKSLKSRAKISRTVQRRSTAVLSTETLKEIQRGADVFDEVHLVPMTLTKWGTKKRQSRLTAAQSMLEVRKGQHPPVDFDYFGWSAVPYQNAHGQKQTKVFETVESAEGVAKTETAATATTDNVHPKGFTPKSQPRSPNRPCIRDVSLYAQLSSISAPIIRRRSYDEDSENDLDHGCMAEEEAFEEELDDAEQEEARDRTVR